MAPLLCDSVLGDIGKYVAESQIFNFIYDSVVWITIFIKLVVGW